MGAQTVLQPAEGAPRETRRSARLRLTELGLSWGLVGFLVILVILFSFIEPTFFTLANVRVMLLSQAVLAIVSLALMVPMIAGEFDLSVAANLGFSGIVAVGVMSRDGLAWPLGVLIGVGVGVLIGTANGLMVTRLRVSSLIATLGMGTVLEGLMQWYTGGTVISAGIPNAFVQLGQGTILGLPLPAFYELAIALVLFYVLEHTPFGRRLYAVGGNPVAARLSGVDTTRLTMWALVLGGGLAGISGVIEASEIAAGNLAVADPFLLQAFAAAFLGGIAIRVGQYNAWGTVIAVLLLTTGVTGLELLGVPYFIEPIFSGGVLAGAATLLQAFRRAGTARAGRG